MAENALKQVDSSQLPSITRPKSQTTADRTTSSLDFYATPG